MNNLAANNITTGAPIVPDLIYDVGIGRYANEQESRTTVVEVKSRNYAEIVDANEINEAA